jgi:hypothetical protein
VSLLCAARFDTPCRIAVQHDADALHAHLELPDGLEMGPGDRIKVHGAPIIVPFGTSVTIDRTATVEVAGPLRRAWTHVIAYFDMAELYEVSFSPGRLA